MDKPTGSVVSGAVDEQPFVEGELWHLKVVGDLDRCLVIRLHGAEVHRVHRVANCDTTQQCVTPFYCFLYRSRSLHCGKRFSAGR